MKIVEEIHPGRVAFATLAPDEMRDLFFVSKYTESDPDSPAPKKHGYQREPMKERVPQIAGYYLEPGHRYLITPIIVSVRLQDPDEIADFVELFNDGDIKGIKDRWHKGVVSVVDGQHRYLGLVEAYEDQARKGAEFSPTVPVMLYFGMDYFKEAELFDIINSTQRKLQKALIEMTKGDITESKSRTHAQAIREIAFALARDKDSVWFDRKANDTSINMTGARDPDRSITYEGLRRSTANMFPAELIERIHARGATPVDFAKEYWKLISESCADAWEGRTRVVVDDQTGEPVIDPKTGKPKEKAVPYRLKELVGVASLARLGKDILASALEHKGDKAKERMVELASKLSDVNWEKREDNAWMRSQAGFAGQAELYKLLHRLVYMDIQPNGGAATVGKQSETAESLTS